MLFKDMIHYFSCSDCAVFTEGELSIFTPLQTQHSSGCMAALDIPKRHSRADSPSVNPEPKQVSTPVTRKKGPASR